MRFLFLRAWIVGLCYRIVKYTKWECMAVKFRFAGGRVSTFRKNAIVVLLLVFVIVDYLVWDLFNASHSIRTVYVIVAHLIRAVVFGIAAFALRHTKFRTLGLKIVVSYAATLFVISFYSGVPGRIPGLNMIPFNILWFWNDPLDINKALKGVMLIFYFLALCVYGALLKSGKKSGAR